VDESTPPDIATTTFVFFGSLSISNEFNFILINDGFKYIYNIYIKLNDFRI